MVAALCVHAEQFRPGPAFYSGRTAETGEQEGEGPTRGAPRGAERERERPCAGGGLRRRIDEVVRSVCRSNFFF